MSYRYVRIESSKGPIVAQLFDRDCPDTVDQFERLARAGRYDATEVEAVAPEGLVLAGEFPEESRAPRIPPETVGNRHRHEPGALTLLTDAWGVAGSRFGIVVSDEGAANLDGRHTVFGTITEGLDVARRLEVGDRFERVSVFA